MRRIFLFLCCAYSCHVVLAQKECPHTEYARKMVAAHPEISDKMNDVEAFTHEHTGDNQTILSGDEVSFSLPAVITIPVVVHVLYNTESQNLSEKQVVSQIEVLTKDFRNQNTDRSKLPAWFTGLAADCGIEFKLARTDPRGFATNGILRRKTSIQFFGTDERVKYTSKGGEDAWDAGKYLNIWVCNLAGGVIGYSSVTGGPAETDGIVIHSSAFGIGGNNGGTFNKGRTATHEIGHWLNLRHLWGDASCGDDKVDDTPSQRSPNRGCPSGKVTSCGTTPNGDLYMNYMDLTNDECMYMFTGGQRERMRSLFLPGGIRHSLVRSNGLAESSLPEPGAILVDDAGSGKEISVYPNPVSATLTVKTNLPEITAGRAFTIYNQTGQPVQYGSFKGRINTVDVSKLAPGIYYLKPADGTAANVTRFIKTR